MERPSLAELNVLCDNKTLINAHFVRRNNGGYTAHVLGYIAFLPGSHSLISNAIPIDQDTLIDTTAPVIIIEVRAEPFKLVVSRREAKNTLALKAEAEKEAAAIEKRALRTEEFSRVNIGDTVEITALYSKAGSTTFQAGSLRIKISKAELGWGDTNFPPHGQTFPCVIIAKDTELQTLEGSIKRLLPDPWITISDRYQPKQALIVRIKNPVKFGVFAEIEPGIDCLIHRSQIQGADSLTDLNQHFSIDNRLPIIIESIDTANRRISASPIMNLMQWAYLRASQQENTDLLSQIASINKLTDDLKNDFQQTEIDNNIIYNELIIENLALEEILRLDAAEIKKSSINEVSKLSLANKKLSGELQKLQAQVEEYEKNIKQLNQKIKQQEINIVAPIEVVEAENKNAVYITFSNAKRLVSGYDLSKENITGNVLPENSPQYNHFNRLEEQQLLAFQKLCKFPEQYLNSAANRVRIGNGNMLFGSTAPAFHSSPKCEFALSDYINYEVPEKIKKDGREEDFRNWWAQRFEENPKYRDDSILMHSLLTRCQLFFELETPPRRVFASNQGVKLVTHEEISKIESQITVLIKNAVAYASSTQNHEIILRLNGKHSYKGNSTKYSVDNPTLLSDEEVRAILRKYESDYKKILISLLQTYYLSKYNSKLAFDHSLLIALGFKPCNSCFSTNERAIMLHHSSSKSKKIDDDLPF